MFYLAGVGLAFFLSLLLVSKRNRSIADNLLTGWLFIVTIHLLLFYFRKENIYPQLLAVEMPFPLLHGPFLFAYTRALTNRALSARIFALHLLPALAVLIRLIPFFLLATEEKQAVFANRGAGYETFNAVRYGAIVVSGILYVVLSSLTLRRHRKAISEEFSNTDKINLAWLQYLIYWIAAVWIGVLLSKDTIVFSTAVLFVLFIGYFGIRQTTIFQSVILPEEPASEPETSLEADTRESDKQKYRKSGLSAEVAASLHRSLGDLMRQEKIFRESELSLSDLAARLNSPPNYLSQVINEREGKSFYDYINTLRVEEFKRLAAGPDGRKYTLLGLAQECGFNSKSSFNRYFKKVTGTSPSQFVPGMQE
jgi:AraC-like DNA-binding protein